jgi:hypothetical protein
LAGLLLDAVVCSAADVAEVPFERLTLYLTPKTGQPDFVAAQTDEEFKKMLEIYDSPAKPYKPLLPPVINFQKRVVVAYFFANSPCEPYSIGRVVESSDVVNLEINHKVQGKNCLCGMSLFQGVLAVSIPRVDKPIHYIIKTSEGLTCTNRLIQPQP